MKSLETPRAKTAADASSAVQMLEELVEKYDECRDKKYDNDPKLQRLPDTPPSRLNIWCWRTDGSATYEYEEQTMDTVTSGETAKNCDSTAIVCYNCGQ